MTGFKSFIRQPLLGRWIKSFFIQTLLPIIVILVLAFFYTNNEKDLAFWATLLIAFFSWINSQILSFREFIRSEASKHKDSISQYIEELFKELELLFSDRSLQEEKLETILTDRVSILELRIKHISTQTEITYLSQDLLADLRSRPLDLLQDPKYERSLIQMKFDLLDAVETAYSKWMDK